MAQSTTISAAPRTRTGKGAARSVRREGRIPGILYGHGEDSRALTVDSHSFKRLLHEVSVENTLIDLTLDGGAPVKVLVREVQRHPYRDEILHVDFFHISMQEKITLEVPVVLVGNPIGVRLHGGILDHSMRDIAVLCFPSDIPEKIEIDVSGLDIGNAVRLSDVQIPNVQILGDVDRTIVSIVPPTVIAPTEAEVAAEGEEPEVIARGKEEAAEGAAGKAEKRTEAAGGKAEKKTEAAGGKAEKKTEGGGAKAEKK